MTAVRTRRSVGLAVGIAATLLLAGPAAGADRALVIGIDDHADARLSPPVATAAADAAAIADTLVTHLAYPAGAILTLVDGAATRQAIVEAFDDWLVAGTGPGDRVFLYFAGLGYFQPDADGDENDGVDETLLPHDAVVAAGTPITIANTLSDDDLRALARRLEGRAVTMVIDAGHAGLVAGADGAAPAATTTRAVALPKTRAIVVEPRVQAQKADGPPMDTHGLGDNVAVFTATSGGQAPIVNDKGGVFTHAFIEAVGGGGDHNANGHVSNAEILAYIREHAEAACTSVQGCALGQTPTFGPAGAAAHSPLGTSGGGALSPDVVLDYFAAGNDDRVALRQIPPSPVYVGQKDIRFRVVSPFAGNLILLDVSDDGRLVQLFPNQYVRQSGREGVLLAGSPVTVPDDYYGISFDATAPASGTLIALVTHEPIDLPAQVKTRAIEVIAREEATQDYLTAIAGALTDPVDAHAPTATRALDWSVATLRYDIIP